MGFSATRSGGSARGEDERLPKTLTLGTLQGRVRPYDETKEAERTGIVGHRCCIGRKASGCQKVEGMQLFGGRPNGRGP